MRVALVLDNTGSMSSANKMTALKTASKSLLNQLKDAGSKSGDVYVSIIPFGKDVNVDPDNYNKDWIKWSGSDDTWDENNGKCKNYSGGSQPKNKSDCLKKSGKWTPNKHNTWNGCVTDRDQDYDTKNTAPVPGNPATLFPAEQYGTCPVPMMALSYDWNALNKKINAMKPDGNTNQTIGLRAGYQSLTARTLHHSAEGFGLHLQGGHHPAHRRAQHRGPLVQRRVADRCAPENYLRQRQGFENHALHDPGQHHRRRNFDAAEGLRQFAGQVLSADVRERDHHGLQSNRDRTVQSAGRQINKRATRRANMKPGDERRASDCESEDYFTKLDLPNWLSYGRYMSRARSEYSSPSLVASATKPS